MLYRNYFLRYGASRGIRTGIDGCARVAAYFEGVYDKHAFTATPVEATQLAKAINEILEAQQAA